MLYIPGYVGICGFRQDHFKKGPWILRKPRMFSQQNKESQQNKAHVTTK